MIDETTNGPNPPQGTPEPIDPENEPGSILIREMVVD